MPNSMSTAEVDGYVWGFCNLGDTDFPLQKGIVLLVLVWADPITGPPTCRSTLPAGKIGRDLAVGFGLTSRTTRHIEAGSDKTIQGENQ
jgi:hypothetical protein